MRVTKMERDKILRKRLERLQQKFRRKPSPPPIEGLYFNFDDGTTQGWKGGNYYDPCSPLNDERDLSSTFFHSPPYSIRTNVSNGTFTIAGVQKAFTLSESSLLNFWGYYNYPTGYISALVDIYECPNNNLLLQAGTLPAQEWTQVNIDLSEFAGKTVRIYFSGGVNVYIDDIIVVAE